MTQHHSPIAHAAYHDLLQSLLDEAVSDLRGTPTRFTQNNRVYWYDSYRVGSSVHKRYIGEDSPDLRVRLEKLKDLREQRDERRRERSRLIKILRAEGFMSLDAGTASLLAAMANSGVFRLGGTVIGTNAFRLYEGELGVRYRFDQLAQTNDIDIASFERLSLALQDTASPSLEQVFSDFNFEPVPTIQPGKTWRWQQGRGNQLVEFLSPSFNEEEDLRPLEALGVSAQSLHYLNFLIADPIPAAVVYRSGVLVQIPRPERFAIHKLIVSDRRQGHDALKARKDLLQAEFLISVLAQDRPDDLADAYQDAISRGAKWRERLERALERSVVAREGIENTR